MDRLSVVLHKKRFFFKRDFFVEKNTGLKKRFFCFFSILLKYMNMNEYGNDFRLFYNTDLTIIKLTITIGCLYNKF